MSSTPRYVITLTVLAILVTAQLFAEDTDLQIVVHVDNYARILGPDRLVAKDVATRIYAKAGVRIVWATGNDKTDAPGLHVRVQLLPSDMAMRKIKTDGLANTVYGVAARGAGRAYIFTHRIASQALRHGDDFRRLLGQIMAHEVGHLVLPAHSHSDNGIMRANIGVREKSGLDFTIEQAVAIRSMLASASRPHTTEVMDAAIVRR
jgi:hypothetical protein